MIIVDASIATKWFLPEADGDAAQALVDDGHKLAAPSLVRFEVTSAILRRVRQGKLSEQKAREACRDWEAMLREGHLELLPAEDLLEEAVDLAIALRHPPVDCLYVAAARRHSAELITADRKLFERASTVYDAITVLTGAATH